MFPKNCSFDVDIDEKTVQQFASFSGDHNPLHVDLAYAATTEFGRPIVHGASLAAFVSRVLGMYIPGKRSLILSMKLRFPKPLFYPNQIRVTGNLSSFDESREAGIVHIGIIEKHSSNTVLEAEVNFALHSSQMTAHRLEQDAALSVDLEKPRPEAGFVPDDNNKTAKARLLITGATGGLGIPVVKSLIQNFELTCLARSTRPVDFPGNCVYHSIDLEDETAFDAFLSTISPSEFYGILNLSSPAPARAFVSQDLSGLRRHFRHAVEVPVLLAKWAMQPDSGVKRVILFGSTAGAKIPNPHMGAYSLAKASTEHLCRLLASDISGQGATVNVVVPGFVPVGINKGVLERTQKSLAARSPTGRLVTPIDIVRVLEFLLSEQSAQINGSVITVDGGVLG